MTPELLHSLIVRPVVEELKWPQAPERELLLVAIAIQESKLKDRKQLPFGPALSLWQIEPKTAVDCLKRCMRALELWKELVIAGALEYHLIHNDLAACAVAAGILRITPGKLPEVGDENGAWEYYQKAWRPGKPGPERWNGSYTKALDVM